MNPYFKYQIITLELLLKYIQINNYGQFWVVATLRWLITKTTREHVLSPGWIAVTEVHLEELHLSVQSRCCDGRAVRGECRGCDRLQQHVDNFMSIFPTAS